MTSQQSLANAVVIHIAALDLEEIVMLSDRKEVKALRVKLLGKGGKPLNRGNLEAVVAALDEERLEALALLLGIQTEAEESVDLHAEPVTTLEVVDNMVQEEEGLPPRLQEALSEAAALVEGAKETIRQRKEEAVTEPVAAPPPRTLVIDNREYQLTEDRQGLVLGREGKTYKVFPSLNLGSSDEEVVASWKAYQASLVREQDEKQAGARIARLRGAAKVLADQIINKPDRAHRLTAVALRDDASRLLAEAGKGLLSRNARERLPLSKIEELCNAAEKKVNELKGLAEAKPEQKTVKAEKAPTQGAQAPQQAGKTPVKESSVEKVQEKKPMEKVNEIKAELAALKETYDALVEGVKRVVRKDFLKNVETIESHIRGGRIEKAEKAIKAQYNNLKNAEALAAKAPTEPTAPAPKAETAPAPTEAPKETIVSNPAVETTPTPAVEPVKEPTVSTEPTVKSTTALKTPKAPTKAKIETKTQRDARKGVKAPTTPAVEAAKTEEPTVSTEPTVAAETVTETKAEAAYGPKTEKEAKAETKAAAKAAKAAAKAAKRKSTILGSMRAVAHNFDQRMKFNFGPIVGTEELKAFAESLSEAVGGEAKNLIDPKGKGQTRQALIDGMNLLAVAAAKVKTNAFTATVNGKAIHVPSRIAELEESGAATPELQKLTSVRDQMATKWGQSGQKDTAAAMAAALQGQKDEVKVALAVHLQALANYGLARNLPEGERFVVKGFKPTVEVAEETKGEKDGQSEMIKAVKDIVEGCVSDKEYVALMNKVALLGAQISRLKRATPNEELSIEAMEEMMMILTMAGGIIDAQRVGTAAPTRDGWKMVKADAPVWNRDHDMIVELVLGAKDGEHHLPGCGEDKRETVGRLAASVLMTWAFGVTAEGGDLIPFEWQRILDGIRNAKQLAEQVSKPGFRGYGKQIVWAFYVGARFVVIRVTGLISWAMSPLKGAWYALKALGMYGMSFASKDSEGYKASARVALTASKESFIDIVRLPWQSVKATWSYIFGGKKASETKGESAPNTTDKKENGTMSKLIKDTGMNGITNNPFGKGETWSEQSFAQKCITGSTLPFRALKRVAVAQPAITTGVVVGGVAGGLVGSMVLGTVGAMTVGVGLAGAVLTGLAVWGVMKLFGGKKASETKAPVAAPAAAPVAAAEAAVVESSSAAA